LVTALVTSATVAVAAPSPASAAGALGRGDLGLALSAVCGGLALLVAAWLLGSALLVLAAAVPGRLGRVADRVARRCVPAALRTAMVAALTVGATAGPGLAGVANADTHRPATPRHSLPDLDRPASPHLQPPPSQQRATPAPTYSHPAAVRPEPTRSQQDAVVVRGGDTLWGIAERALGPTAAAADVAAAWPRWWAANRDVIGPDPDLIHPGQRLVAPSD
jgi:nucleoid-associated protein YgaU